MIYPAQRCFSSSLPFPFLLFICVFMIFFSVFGIFLSRRGYVVCRPRYLFLL